MTPNVLRLLRAFTLVFLLAPSGHAAAIAEGQPAPPLDGTLMDGARFSLGALAGKVVVVNFWASWCAPCREEMPALDAYYRRHRAEGLELVAISMDRPNDEAKAREIMRAFSFPAAFGREMGLKPWGRIWRLPMTFVVDRQGVLRKDGWYGEAMLDVPTLEATVTPLLRARSGPTQAAPAIPSPPALLPASHRVVDP